MDLFVLIPVNSCSFTFLSKLFFSYDLFILSIDGEVVPLAGDRVRFKKILIPPKNEKYQAVHVKIVDYVPEKHQRWQELPVE